MRKRERPFRASVKVSVKKGRRSPKLVSSSRCVSASSLPKGVEWQYELKLDGSRALAIKTAGKLLLWSRNHKDCTTRYRSIADAL